MNEHLFIGDLRKHPDAEVCMFVDGRLVSGTFTHQVTGSIDAMIAEAKAEALREAAEEFESSVGVTEFAEQSRRDGVPWAHAYEDWEHQGPYMDWLRNRADKLEQATK